MPTNISVVGLDSDFLRWWSPCCGFPTNVFLSRSVFEAQAYAVQKSLARGTQPQKSIRQPWIIQQIMDVDIKYCLMMLNVYKIL